MLLNKEIIVLMVLIKIKEKIVKRMVNKVDFHGMCLVLQHRT
jgi:hypothetical protein